LIPESVRRSFIMPSRYKARSLQTKRGADGT
jgi:hypothetical protein